MTDETTETEATEEYPAGALVLRTFVHAGAWTSSEGDTYSDLCIIESPSETLIRDAGHAHAAGVLEVLQGLDLSGVQSQEDGEAAYTEAQGDWIEPVYTDDVDAEGEVIGRTLVTPGHWSGPWQDGQNELAALEAEARDRGEPTIVVDVQEEEA